jgi:hypothetical protein
MTRRAGPEPRPTFTLKIEGAAVPARKAEFPSHEQALRAALAWVRARHDSGAISPAVFSVIRMIETEIAWRQHTHGVRS